MIHISDIDIKLNICESFNILQEDLCVVFKFQYKLD